MPHICDEKDCPYFGQPSPANSCRCHKTELQMLRSALKPFADLGVGSGPDEQQDSYRIEYRAIRAARAALR